MNAHHDTNDTKSADGDDEWGYDNCCYIASMT